jgi:hypothetical protein
MKISEDVRQHAAEQGIAEQKALAKRIEKNLRNTPKKLLWCIGKREPCVISLPSAV